MSSFAGAQHFTIAGGNFGYVGGSVNHYTYGVDALPPNHLLPPAGQIAPATPSNLSPPNSQPASPPNTQSASLPNSQSPSAVSSPSPSSPSLSFNQSQEGSSNYETPPSSIASDTQSRRDPSAPIVPPTSHSRAHVAPPSSTALSSISIDLQQLPTTPNPTFTSSYRTPKTRPSDDWHNNSLGYSHRREQSLELPSQHRNSNQPPQSPHHHQSNYTQPTFSPVPPTNASTGYPPRPSYEHGPSNGPLPATPSPLAPPTVPYHSRPPLPPREPEYDPSTEFAHLQSQRSTKGYPTHLNTDVSPSRRATTNADNDNDNCFSDHQGHDTYNTRTPTNDLGLYTTPSQPNIPPVSDLTRSFSTPTRPAHSLPSPPPNTTTHGPWTTGTIANWSNDVNQHEPPQNIMSIREHNMIDNVHQRGYAGDLRSPPLPCPPPLPPMGAGMQPGGGRVELYSTGTGSAPYVPRDESPQFFGGADARASDGSGGVFTPTYTHISPFMFQAPSASPFILNVGAGSVMRRDRMEGGPMELREPGFVAPPPSHYY